MKKLFFISTILFAFMNVFGQATAKVGNEYVPVSFSSNFFTSIPKQKTAPKGSVYLKDKYVNGMILINDNQYIDNVKLNFNFHTNKLEVKNNDTIYNIDPYKIKWFTIKGSDFGLYTTPGKLKMYPELSNCNLIKLYYDDNNLKLIEKYYLKLLKSNYNTAVDAGETSDTYVVSSKMFIVKDNKVYKFSKNKHSILSIFSDKKDEIKTFVKENHLKYNKMADILKILKYYSSLQK